MNAIPNNLQSDGVERAQELINKLPAWVWNTTIPATLFRIYNNTAELVPKDYRPKEGDLVFSLTSLKGFVSIQKIYPLTS
jgi:hypothetical protein